MAVTPRPSWLYLLVGGASWPIVKVLFRHRARGVENVPPSGGLVLAANHWSNFDPWPLAIPFFPRRFFRFMAKAELFWFPLGWIVSAGGAFKVRRGEQDDEAIAMAIELAREGSVVVMFPEGTRRQKGLRKRHEARWRQDYRLHRRWHERAVRRPRSRAQPVRHAADQARHSCRRRI